MALSVKNKIRLGTLFLFGLLLLTGAAGIYYTAQLKSQTRAVLKDNYESLAYAQVMQAQLELPAARRGQGLATFDSALRLQERNVTEPGERQPTADLRRRFTLLRTNGAADTDVALLQALRTDINRVAEANMAAISEKSAKAEKTAADAFAYILGLCGIIFVIALSFVVNFPSVVTGPISSFTEAIGKIAAKNYAHRIDLNRHDEFGRMAEAFNEMAERLQHFENSNLAKLLFEKSRAEAVINSLKDASIGLDKDGRILFANVQALQLLSLKATDVVGKPAAEVSARNDLFCFLLQNESNAPFKIVVDNRENYFTKETIEVTQGESESKVIVIRNITSFKELDAAKTNFIATISHELKTPLAASDFSLKLLGDARTGPLNEEQQALVQAIREDNQRMLKILSELLNMAQVEAGRIQLARQPVAPQRIVDAAVQTVAALARENEVRIFTETTQNLPEISADAEKTTWVLNNLLTNAIKYSGRGSTVAVRVEQTAGGLQFAVQDSGAGIAKEHQEHLFDRFYQAPGGRLKGSGLGLAISKDFIEAQGGRIWVESEAGQGATFCFTLPVV